MFPQSTCEVAAPSVLVPFARYKFHTHLFHMLLLHQFLPTSLEMGIVIILVLQLRKPRHAEAAYLPHISRCGRTRIWMWWIWLQSSLLITLPCLDPRLSHQEGPNRWHKWGRQAGTEWWSLGEEELSSSCHCHVGSHVLCSQIFSFSEKMPQIFILCDPD